MNKVRVGVLGATGMVGQRFVSLLENHPWFEVTTLAASPSSAGKTYAEAVEGRWKMKTAIPQNLRDTKLYAVEADLEKVRNEVDFVFSAIDMDKDAIRRVEEAYAAAGMAVVSNNSAHRWSADVPMIIPEINPQHADVIKAQQKNRGWTTGFIAVKPNCSIQSYVPVIEAWKQFEPMQVIVTTLQAISGSGKTFAEWPEMVDNVIPLIPGEEEKSEKEPLKIWATFENGAFTLASTPKISVNCIRVPVTDGHMASVHISFAKKPSQADLIAAISTWKNPLAELALPSAPDPFVTYFEDDNRPQTRLDRDLGNGMGISFGRLREDSILDYKFVALSHNTLRGAAGGAILLAELLKAKGFITA